MLFNFLACLLLTTNPGASGPTEGDLQDALKEYETLLIKIDDPKHHKQQFKNKTTGKIRTVSDLSDAERRVFFCTKVEHLEQTMRATQIKWANFELHLLAKEKHPEYLPTGLSAADVARYKMVLIALRVKVAAKHEAVVEELYKVHPNLFTAEEAELHTQQLRERHDQEKLLERPRK